jgi:hypothetical protein
MIPGLPTPEKPPRFPKITLLKGLSRLWWHIKNPKEKNTMSIKLKPGVSSTELWVVVGAGVAQIGLAVMGMIDAEWAAAGVTILGSIYTLIRGGLKSKPQG